MSIDGPGTQSLEAPGLGIAAIQDSSFIGNAVVESAPSGVPLGAGGAIRQQGSLALLNCSFLANHVQVGRQIGALCMHV